MPNDRTYGKVFELQPRTYVLSANQTAHGVRLISRQNTDPLFRAGSPIAVLQRTLGNRQVRHLVESGRLSREGRIMDRPQRMAGVLRVTERGDASFARDRDLRGGTHLLAKLIQRDGPHQGGEASQDEKEALVNFKNDWQNNFAHYDRLIKLSGRSYSKDQKEPIKAVKQDNALAIVLGNPYATETEEKTRWQWIKAEVIDKNVKSDKFEDIAYDPTHSKLNEIAPPYAAGQYCALNCPATAAALDEYLRTGKISPAICNPHQESTQGYGFDISKNTFSASVDWKNAEATVRKQLKKHGDFVIVEATRSEQVMKEDNVAKNHYFAVVNVKGQLFAMDAFGGGIVDDDLQDYINTRIKAVTYRMVKGEFKVKEVIPKH